MKFVIDKNYENVRLDKFLRKHLPNTPLTEIFKGIRTGKIKVNNKKSKENYRLCLDDIIEIFLNGVSTQIKESNCKIPKEDIEKLKKMIVYEDDNLLILNKGANLVMHKGSGHNYGAVEILKEYLKNEDFTFINRIDKATSGLVIGAKNLVTIRELSELMRDREICKKYYILVDGIVKNKNFIVETYLKKIEDKVIEVDEYEEGAKISKSIFKVVRYGENMTLLEGELKSGRTHQLRVQLATRGHSIIGDSRYGKKINSKYMFLFSYYLKIPKYNIEISLPLPKEYNKKLDIGGK